MDGLTPKSTTPNHIAFIMDGNRRWAQQRNLSTADGHAAGIKALEDVLAACKTVPIPVVSVYAFSSENWQRPEEEKEKLFQLMEYYLTEKAEKLIVEGTRFRFIGNVQLFNNKLKKLISEVEDYSRHNKKYTLQLALGYGGRDEIVRAVNKLLKEENKTNDLPKEITEADFSKLLDTKTVCYPDLLIRTGGERRLSNFLLYQMAYTELYFTPILWPDFNAADLQSAIHDYSNRERRYGLRLQNTGIFPN